ncbi:single insulin-like growth factor-binding domain protein-2 [Haliotis rufescens]|uniref:single insulin-like growth factor-binding domain protein-2 n=1 Tax=Haliotis rufescens TaxID=6454 RepID=UPI001EAF8DA4|nr:single insulin-like growth factor-binding domain protein-2 [Haliotis rufescens]
MPVTMNIVYVAVVLASLMQLSSALECVSCENATCIPPPPTCEIGQRPCSCCLECRVGLGGECGPFSVECNANLVCLTNNGAYNGRPPYWTGLVGKCILPSGLLPSTATPSQIIPTLPKLLTKNVG